MLQSDGLADNTDATIDALTSKHPDSRTTKLPRLLDDSSFVVSSEDVISVVENFAKGSSPGRSSLRPEHLQDALKDLVSTPRLGLQR